MSFKKKMIFDMKDHVTRVVGRGKLARDKEMSEAMKHVEIKNIYLLFNKTSHPPYLQCW